MKNYQRLQKQQLDEARVKLDYTKASQLFNAVPRVGYSILYVEDGQLVEVDSNSLKANIMIRTQQDKQEFYTKSVEANLDKLNEQLNKYKDKAKTVYGVLWVGTPETIVRMTQKRGLSGQAARQIEKHYPDDMIPVYLIDNQGSEMHIPQKIYQNLTK